MNFAVYKSGDKWIVASPASPEHPDSREIKKSEYTSRTKALHSFTKRLANVDHFIVVIPDATEIAK